MVESYELLLCLGMLASALGDAAFQGLPGNWRWMVGAPVVPALLLSRECAGEGAGGGQSAPAGGGQSDPAGLQGTPPPPASARDQPATVRPPAVSLCLLPESPRWLVIRGRLDEALAVIHRVHQGESLPAGMQHSSAEVEHELMHLWSSVEKDRDATAAARAQHAERARRRAEARETKLAPIGSSPLGLGSGGSSADGGGDTKGRWQRLDPAEDEDAQAGGGGGAAAGAAGVHARMQQAVAAAEAEDESREQRGLLPSGGGEQARSDSPLRVPPHLRRIRTSSAQNLQLLGEQQGAGLQEVELLSAPSVAASADVEAGSGAGAAEPLAAAGEWGTATRSGSQQLDRLPSALGRQGSSLLGQLYDGEGGDGGGGCGDDGGPAGGARREPSFWATLRDMIGNIYLVSQGPERNALQVLGRSC